MYYFSFLVVFISKYSSLLTIFSLSFFSTIYLYPTCIKRAKSGTAHLQPGQVEIDSTLRKSSGQVNLQISFYSANGRQTFLCNLVLAALVALFCSIFVPVPPWHEDMLLWCSIDQTVWSEHLDTVVGNICSQIQVAIIIECKCTLGM